MRILDESHCLDFGTVALGEETSRTLTLESLAREPVHAWVDTFSGDFIATPRTVPLAPGARGSATITFRPTWHGEQTGEVYVRACDICPVHRRCMTGSGTGESFDVTPEPTFRDIAAGTTSCLDITMLSIGAAPFTPLSLELHDLDLSLFEVRSSEVIGRPIPPGSSATFPLCFTPARGHAMYQQGGLRIAGRFASGDLRVRALAAIPEAIAQWASGPHHVVLGGTAVLGIGVRNHGSPGTIAVDRVEVVPDDGTMRVSGPTLPVDLDDPCRFDVAITPTLPPYYEGKVRFHVVPDDVWLEVTLALEVLESEECDFVVEPAEQVVPFVLKDWPYRSQVVLRNRGGTPCEIGALGLDPGGSPRFSLGPTPEIPLTLQPASAYPIEWNYPGGPPPVDDATRLLVELADGETRSTTLRIAHGMPCVELSTYMLYAQADVGVEVVRKLTLANCGARPLILGGNMPERGTSGDIGFRADSGTGFRVIEHAPFPIEIAEGGSTTITVGLTPGEQGGHAWLEIWPLDGEAPIQVETSVSSR